MDYRDAPYFLYEKLRSGSSREYGSVMVADTGDPEVIVIYFPEYRPNRPVLALGVKEMEGSYFNHENTCYIWKNIPNVHVKSELKKAGYWISVEGKHLLKEHVSLHIELSSDSIISSHVTTLLLYHYVELTCSPILDNTTVWENERRQNIVFPEPCEEKTELLKRLFPHLFDDSADNNVPDE